MLKKHTERSPDSDPEHCFVGLFWPHSRNLYILKCRWQWQLTAVKLLAAAVQAARGGPRAAFRRSATVGRVTIAAMMRVTVLRLAAVFRQLRAGAQQLTRRRQCPGPGRKQCPGPIRPARRRAQCSRRSRAPFRYGGTYSL
jgi:hypothetical protein